MIIQRITLSIIFLVVILLNIEIKGQKVHECVGMIWIKGGSFLMGSPYTRLDEECVQHKVTLNGFYMDKTEITQGEYIALMRVNPSYFKGDDKLPVTCVTWYDAVLYCNARSKRDGLEPVYWYSGVKGKKDAGCEGFEKMNIDYNKNGYRLPTEAEWEYACRAGTTTLYFWGDEMDAEYVWNSDNCENSIHPVGQKKANNWGLYDMCGNVWEWCNDWYMRKYYTSETKSNPRGPDSGNSRVLRGGSCDGRQNDVVTFRSAYRSSCDPSNRTLLYGGFRCVRCK